ncbi:AbrB/MazE/SpoVT family DNA-binding domain-containing protein [Brevibacillus composti]|uniref:AbrB/MazE/SpoVT family DNA-binding domain-containing protein n=1 Tax=Brevibacillus composti TaxID=2796470 RepID=A0ABX7ZA12_9BACL|nr:MULTISPECIES: AbrB/MazE/SpoVT family DNA-binding domain-containing protein [Paenibacillaceae]PZM65738.1 AbrB family transcriptional regulator [Paenibacillus dendritiformis]QUO43437.1 AbrB/MazE/SpoVT family DNA-binding domain-containing protein [Brevibacillus composti]
MKSFNKKISKSGSITLPASLRREYGLAEGEKFKIEVDKDGTILLHRTQGHCLFCGAEEEIVTHAGRQVCAGCISMMAAKARGAEYADEFDSTGR